MKAKAHLNEGGVIIVKENSSDKGFYVDKEDCTVVRSSMLYRKLFEQAGLKVIKEQKQSDWPTDLFEPLMFALVWFISIYFNYQLLVYLACSAFVAA